MDISKYSDLNQSLNASEEKLYESIAKNCADEFQYCISGSLTIIDKTAKTLSGTSEKLASCDGTITKVLDSATEMIRKVNDSSNSIDSIKTALSEANDTISQESVSIKDSVSSLEKAVADSRSNISAFSNTMENTAQRCSNAVEDSLNSLEQLRSTLDSLGKAVDTCQKSWSTSAGEQCKKIEEFSMHTDQLCNDLSAISTASSESISESSEKVKAALDRACELSGSVSETIIEISSMRDQLALSVNEIKKKTEVIKVASESLDSTVSKNNQVIDDFSKTLDKATKEYSDSIQATIDELIRLNGEISKCNQAIIEATTNWKASSDESAESMTAIKNKLDELYNRFASVVDESIGHVRSSTEQYSTLLDSINNKLQEKYDNMSDGIDELKQSVGILDSRVKRVTVISIIAACILLVMEIVNIIL